MRRVKLNHRTVGEYLDGRHGVEELLDRRAQRALEAARAAAPVASGHYRRTLQVQTVHTDRIVKRVVAAADYAVFVEARDGVLSRSLDAAGGA